MLIHKSARAAFLELIPTALIRINELFAVCRFGGAIMESEDTFFEAMSQFRQTRAPIVEKEYYETYGDRYNQRIRNELYDRILRLLPANKSIVIDFANRDAACYNPNTDYFYNRGFEDCLLFLRMFAGVADKNFSLERYLIYCDRVKYDAKSDGQDGQGRSACR